MGRILLRNRPAQKGLRLRLYHHAFGAAPVMLCDCLTQEGGYYSLDYHPQPKPKRVGKNRVSAQAEPAQVFNTEVRSVRGNGRNQRESSISEVQHNAARYLVLNIELMGQVQRPTTEYERLKESLAPYLPNLDALANLHEDGKRSDRTLLSKSAQVNRALITQAAMAVKLKADTGMKVEPLYALMRSGLPGEPQRLCMVDPRTVEETLTEAAASGQVALGKGGVRAAVEAFTKFAQKTLPTLKLPGSSASYANLLKISGLTPSQQNTFTQTYFTHKGDDAALWESLQDKLPAPQIEELRLQGKLCFLTLNNLTLVERLQAEARKAAAPLGLAWLADRGYDDAAKWETLVAKVAREEGKKQEDLVPPGFPGETARERVRSYAVEMAAKVRESYPLQALRRRIQGRDPELLLGRSRKEHDEISGHVVDFLTDAERAGFELGRTALGRFLKENEGSLFKRVAPTRELRAEMIAGERKDLDRRAALRFMQANWKQIAREMFSGLRGGEAKTAKAAVTKALRRSDLQRLTVSGFLKKESRNPRFAKAIGGTANAARLRNSLAALVKQEQAGFGGRAEARFKRRVVECVKTLVRLSQIAPDGEVLQVLYKLGLHSAREVSAFSPQVFKESFLREGKKLAAFKQGRVSEERLAGLAQLVQRKAALIHATALNVVAIAQTLEGPSAAAVSGSSGDPTTGSGEGLATDNPRRMAMQQLVSQYPTLEQLLGSTDFCECEDCRSVLSPAAYFVDLLRFLEHADPNPYDSTNESWAGFTQGWKERHGGAPYPFTSVERLETWNSAHPADPPLVELTPYQILLRHRPDLPHIPLTCENTHTALPYIDLVNEILEYWLLNPEAADTPEDDLMQSYVRYDTGQATTAELLAEPQNLLPDAYKKLRDEDCYPLALPFDLWLETVRLFFDHFDTPMWKALEAFRQVDELELFASEEPRQYYRAQICAECLSLSPSEYAILTGSSGHGWYELYGYASPTVAGRELRSAKTLSRRLGVTYRELVDVVKTRFVNPGLPDLGLLWKLGVEVGDAVRYFENRSTAAAPGTSEYAGTQRLFEERLAELGLKYQQSFAARHTSAQEELEKLWPSKFREALVLRDRHGFDPRVVRCDFGNTYLEYADSEAAEDHPAESLDFLRINLFVRLWRRLGWTIEETDMALAAFWPKASLPVTEDNRADAFRTALLYLAHFKYLAEELNPGKDGLQKLICLWSDIPTSGRASFYAQLFLAPSLVREADADPIFDDPLGEYLQNPEVKMEGQLAVLQGALGLKDGDVRRVLEDAGLDLATELTLANVSLLYRYGLLSKLLKLSIKELITLKALSGLNPFKPLEVAHITKLDDDHPFRQTIRFVAAATTIKQGGFKVEVLDYLLRHRFDPVGRYRGEIGAMSAFARATAQGIRNIDVQVQALENPAAVTDDLLLEMMELYLSPAAAKEVFDVLKGEKQVVATWSTELSEASRARLSLFDGEASISAHYDDIRGELRMTCRGILSRERLKALRSSVQAGTEVGSFRVRLKEMLDELAEKSRLAFAEAVKMILDAFENEALADDVDPDEKLDSEAFPGLFSGRYPLRASYDEARRVQRLGYYGVLLDEQKAEILQLTEGSPVEGVLARLLDDVQTKGAVVARSVIQACVGRAAANQEFAAGLPIRAIDSLDPRDFVLEPAVWVSFIPDPADAAQGEQQLSYRGLLGNAKRDDLVDVASHPTVAARLLGKTSSEDVSPASVQTQGKLFVEGLRAGVLDAMDFDGIFDAPELGAFPQTLEQGRVDLWKSVSAVVRRSLIHRFAAESLASTFAADPDTTALLLGDSTLMADRENRPVLDSFSRFPGSGMSATYFRSDSATQATRINDDPLTTASIDTTELHPGTAETFRPTAARSARFEGFLEVPRNGAYRFFAFVEKEAASVEFRIDLQPEPVVVEHTAETDADEVGVLVDLHRGVPYRLSVLFRNLGNGEARLEVLGENLPRGPLSRLTLYPAAAIEGFERARILMGKALQIVRTLELNSREARYLLSHRDDFDGLDWGALPIEQMAADAAEDEDLPSPQSLFEQILRVINYARLKREIAGGEDELIGIFECVEKSARNPLREPDDASQSSNADADAPWKRMADLTQRNPSVVRKIATRFGLIDARTVSVSSELELKARGDFANEKGLWRIWEALQIVERFGLSADELFRTMAIVSEGESGFPIATHLRSAVRANYDPQAWLRIVQPISDRLRRMKRDALVASAMGSDPERFPTAEALFEHFLIDPQMEPVVRTSRIRLALESVRRFVQRCLDGKEPWVSPAAINKDQWAWRKHYRVFEANRKIWLFPQNWLEPEFRDDKTHLFKDLEASLLQGDVTDELAEDAYFAYLKGLEQIARLDIVTTYMEGKDDPRPGTLHAIGRTHNPPHKHFYRSYDGSEWTPWEPVPVEIQGNNLVVIVWKQRVHLFWLTYMERAVEDNNSGNKAFEDMAKSVPSQISRKRMDVQLNWCDHFQGEWGSQQASGYVDPDFGPELSVYDTASASVSAAKESADGAVLIRFCLNGTLNVGAEYIPKSVLNVSTFEQWYSVTVPVDAATLALEWLSHFWDSYLKKVYCGSVQVPDVGSCSYYIDLEIYRRVVSEQGRSPDRSEVVFVVVPAHRTAFGECDYTFGKAFRLMNRNCPPELVPNPAWPWIPYQHKGRKFARYSVGDPLKIDQQEILTKFGMPTLPTVRSAHRASLTFPDYSGVDSVDSSEQYTWVHSKPFFYQDGSNAFFVQPSHDKGLREFNGWAPRFRLDDPFMLKVIR
ncbi:MAG: neuraminidase-like domain-containing protein [Acidobacteria bacterium]|nr:neuraminidase-like domain-containing protein [Acidobacteriota bacterium]